MKRLPFAPNTDDLILSCFEKLSYPKGYVFAPHYHMRAEIMYVVSGKISFEIFNDSQHVSESLTENQFIIFDRGTPHGFEVQADETVFWTIEFNNLNETDTSRKFSLTEAFTENSTLYFKIRKNGYAVYYDQANLDKSIARLTNAYATSSYYPKKENSVCFRENDYLFHVYLQEFFILISLNVSMFRSSGTQYISRINAFLQRNYASDLSLDELADTIGINKHYMERLFKKYTGNSIHQLILFLRCEKAKKLLVTSSLSIEKIAQSTGFGVRQQLIYNFKKLYGITPYEYRLLRRDESKKLLPDDALSSSTYDFIANP